MKKYLISNEGSFYKANLHCHSTVSDGRLTPEELKEAYKSLGYSILAYTDHDVMIPHKELRDADFLPLTGVEFDIANDKVGKMMAEGGCVHFNFIALDEDMEIQPLWHREKYIPPKALHSKPLVKFDENEPDYERTYSPECVNDMMRIGREKNFYVIYNHPTWSHETYAEYSRYENMHAMEIINNISNTGCGVYEYNDRVYDDMLRLGKRIDCVATDDTHVAFPLGNRKCDIGGAWTMIKAKSLDYSAVAEALKNGDFYASEGPVLNSLWYEDGKICVECEAADRIIFTSYPQRGYAYFDESGEGLTYAEHTLTGREKFIRVTLVDKFGKRAYTSAYFIDEITD